MPGYVDEVPTGLRRTLPKARDILYVRGSEMCRLTVVRPTQSSAEDFVYVARHFNAGVSEASHVGRRDHPDARVAVLAPHGDVQKA